MALRIRKPTTDEQLSWDIKHPEPTDHRAEFLDAGPENDCHCTGRIELKNTCRRFSKRLGEYFNACRKCRGFLTVEQCREVDKRHEEAANVRAQ